MSDERREVRIGGRRVYEGRVVTLEVDSVRVPSGREATREVIRHLGAAVMLPIAEDGRVVFVRQFRYPTGSELLELPAGKLESGEDPAVCACRELAEEIGFSPATLKPLGCFYTAPGFTDELLWAFLATGLEQVPGFESDPDEILEVVALTPNEIRQAVRAGGIRDAKTLATLYLFDALGGG